MNKFQKMLQKLNDEKVKIEKEREYILSACEQINAFYHTVKTADFSTKYGKRIIRSYEKMLEKMDVIINDFDNEYADILGAITNSNVKGDSENE